MPSGFPSVEVNYMKSRTSTILQQPLS